MYSLTEDQNEAVLRYFNRDTTRKYTAAGRDKTKEHVERQPIKPEEEPKPEAVKAPAVSVNHKGLSFNLKGLTERGVKDRDVKDEALEVITETKIKLDSIVAPACGPAAEAVIAADESVHAAIEVTKAIAGDLVAGSDQLNDKVTTSKTVITCDGEVQFDYEMNQAYFFKNVKVVSEDATIDSDKITVYFDPDTKRLTEILAEGNVRLMRGDNITYSHMASYSEVDKKITLSGKPRFILSPDGGIGFNANFMPASPLS